MSRHVTYLGLALEPARARGRRLVDKHSDPLTREMSIDSPVPDLGLEDGPGTGIGNISAVRSRR
jgi:hypothetical protein